MRATLIAAFSFVAAFGVGAEDDAFAESPPDPPRPERTIAALPRSVSYDVRNGSHVYTITGIYATSPEHDIDDPRELSTIYIPDCEDCSFDFEKRICTIRTKRNLTNSELAYAIDDIAEMGGDMPYWAELTARDIPETDEFSYLDFAVEEFMGDFPERLAWFSLPDDQPFEIPFPITQIDRFKVLIVPTTAFCMCHSRYCIRILDPAGKLVWKDSTTAFAGMSVAIAASENGFGPELLLRRYDHGKEASFVVKLKSEQIGAGQSAPRSESDAKGGDKPQPESEGRSR